MLTIILSNYQLCPVPFTPMCLLQSSCSHECVLATPTNAQPIPQVGYRDQPNTRKRSTDDQCFCWGRQNALHDLIFFEAFMINFLYLLEEITVLKGRKSNFCIWFYLYQYLFHYFGSTIHRCVNRFHACTLQALTFALIGAHQFISGQCYGAPLRGKCKLLHGPCTGCHTNRPLPWCSHREFLRCINVTKPRLEE